jgi:cytochrome c peroxidase
LIDVAALLESNLDYDGIGHYGPVLVRLAWHASGTYDVASKTGGSDGATMRFDPEAKFGANAGLQIARDLLEPIKKKYGDSLSYGDLWTLAGVVAVKQMGGPSVPWRPGRVDAKDGSKCPPDGRLPDASKDQKHVREIFGRMGFNDQEMVALCGAHALGKCHTDRSGFKGPWTFSPVSFTNAYFTELLNQKWVKKTTDEIVKDGKHVKTEWRGPEQFVDEKTGSLMMLKTDLALIKDPQFKHWVDIYAKDQSKFFEDFSKAFAKLLELGVSDKVLGNKPVNF